MKVYLCDGPKRKYSYCVGPENCKDETCILVKRYRENGGGSENPKSNPG